MEQPTEPLRVLVIGAGPTGLLIAQVLKQNGISSTVFEQDAFLGARPRDWNFGVYWAQSPLSECLPPELNAQLESVQVDSHTPSADDSMSIFNGQTAEVVNVIPTPYTLRLQRLKFIKLISTGIDIRYGKRLANIHTEGEKATATFEDGSTETGNLVIGAEGAHSKVREFLFGKEKAALKPSPLVASFTIARLDKQAALDIRKLHPRHCISFHPKGIFAWVGVHNLDSDNPEEWLFMLGQSCISDEPTGLHSRPDITRDLKKRAEELAKPFRAAFESIADDTPIWHNRLSYWVTEPWDNRNGTVTLAGDAAHSMTFHRGQGLNNAILDVAHFGRRLAEMKSKTHASLCQAVSEYEKEVWTRGSEAVLSSNENSLSIHDWAKLQHSPLFRAGLRQKVDSKAE
ncbi:hypothetical protein FQN50_004788 [Emmonsiellopsis sp. PD_5]|nr:hypothetical protein FQN50_004788 [Emmonsiellopsis sp. PD_5]